MRPSTIVTQAVANGTARRTTESRPDSRAGRSTDAVAEHRTAGRSEATANGGFRTIAFVCPDGAAGRAADTGPDGRAGAAAELPADNVTQHTTQTTADRRGTIAGSHGALGHEQS